MSKISCRPQQILVSSKSSAVTRQSSVVSRPPFAVYSQLSASASNHLSLSITSGMQPLQPSDSISPPPEVSWSLRKVAVSLASSVTARHCAVCRSLHAYGRTAVYCLPTTDCRLPPAADCPTAEVSETACWVTSIQPHSEARRASDRLLSNNTGTNVGAGDWMPKSGRGKRPVNSLWMSIALSIVTEGC